MDMTHESRNISKNLQKQKFISGEDRYGQSVYSKYTVRESA